MVIRPATAADRDSVYRFSSLLTLRAVVDRQVFDEQFDQALVTASSTVLVAEEAGQPIGFLLATIAPMFVYGGGMGFVQELYVDEVGRRSGVGTALMSAFAVIAVQAGATIIALATSRAGAFYGSLGFSTSAAYYSAPVATLASGSSPKISRSAAGRAGRASR